MQAFVVQRCGIGLLCGQHCRRSIAMFPVRFRDRLLADHISGAQGRMPVRCADNNGDEGLKSREAEMQRGAETEHEGGKHALHVL